MNAMRTFDARRWVTIGVLLAAAITVGLLLVTLLSAPATAHHRPGHGDGGGNPSVDLAERVEALEAQVAILEQAVYDDVVGLAKAHERLDSVEADLSDEATGLDAAHDAIDELGEGVGTAQNRISALEVALEDDEAGLEAAHTRLEFLDDLLAGVSRDDDAHGRDTLTFAEMNLQVVNGTGTTDGNPDGVGNLIIGYNAGTGGQSRTGSHYLIVGDEHEWTSFGGIVAGHNNTASADGASVLGGVDNTAEGWYASVTGGTQNTAGNYASVSGGHGNHASGLESSVSGGNGNTASGLESSVSGGNGNTASGLQSSVSGGIGNVANGTLSSVSGGRDNTASGDWSSILGGSGVLLDSQTACHPSCP